MTQLIKILVDRLYKTELLKNQVIPWACPVPSFGDVENAKMATIGINPSNAEFEDKKKNELDGINKRRFHTLKSLGIKTWSQADQPHYSQIWDYCKNYFSENGNPYYTWFNKLSYIISGTSASYKRQACHLDLIPYATSPIWGRLTRGQQTSLLEISRDTLGLLLNKSHITSIVLNGRTVVDNLEKIANLKFEKIHMPEWTLPRKNSSGVPGFAYQGKIETLGGIKLKGPIRVLGYNHNIQSSHGVTTAVQTAIRNWISQSSNDIL
jgi:hypothetical protein